jgi:hypothetical protein
MVASHKSMVQARPSSHVIGVWLQVPFDKQESTVHLLLSSQVLMTCEQPESGLQESKVQGLLSLQSTSSNLHLPVAGSHASLVHWLLSSHWIGSCWHPAVAEQVSIVHARLSSQSTAVYAHCPLLSHWSFVHRLLSLQFLGV